MVTDNGCIGCRTSRPRTQRVTGSGSSAIIQYINGFTPSLADVYCSPQIPMNTQESLVRRLVMSKRLMRQSRTSLCKFLFCLNRELIWGQSVETTIKQKRRGASKDVDLREARYGVYRRSKGIVNNLVWNLGRIALRQTRKYDKCNSRSVHSKGKVGYKLVYILTKYTPWVEVNHFKKTEMRPEGTQLIRRFK